MFIARNSFLVTDRIHFIGIVKKFVKLEPRGKKREFRIFVVLSFLKSGFVFFTMEPLSRGHQSPVGLPSKNDPNPFASRRQNFEAKQIMRLILAVIPPDRLDAVKNELAAIHVFRLTVMDVQGFGTVKNPVEPGKGREAELNLTRRIQVMIGVNEEFVEPTINAVRKGVHADGNDHLMDGKIFLLPLDDCIRIRTGERGGEAI